MSVSSVEVSVCFSTAMADNWEAMILEFGILGLIKFETLRVFEVWKRVLKMGLWELRSGEPVRKVELRWRRWRLVVKSMFGRREK